MSQVIDRHQRSIGGPEHDPITFSVMLGRFNSIVEEMTRTLEHTAWTPLLAVSRDFSCAIYDAVPRQVSMYDALPIHTTSLHLVLEQVVDAFKDEIHDGDVYLCNDPYRGNTHIGDLVTARPVFVDGRHVFWSVTRGHQLDVGAFIPSSVTASSENVYQEGLTIPPVKLVDADLEREDLTDLYLSNVRYRDLLHGDLMAQMASIEKGRQRLVELCEEYGTDIVLSYVDELIEYADRRMSAEIEEIPDGEYTAENWVDSDGFDQEHLPIQVKVTVKGDHVTVDFTGSAPQVRGGVNGSFATTQATAAIPFLYYIDPDIPHNHGCIRHISVVAPKGTITNAEHPASTSCATAIPSDCMHDAVNRAMAVAIPDRVPGGGTKQSNLPQFSGIRPRTREAWGVMIFNGTGGSGASHGADGWPLYESIDGLGAVKAQSIEQLELLYPVRIEQMSVDPGSMGLGRWNGGPGTRLVVLGLAGEMECVTFGDGVANPPHGVLGGTAGSGGGAYVEDPETGHRTFFSASGHIRIPEGHRWIGVSTGGGGYGPPLERPMEQVRLDVLDGLIDRDIARDVFGVLLSDDPTHEIDVESTRQERARLAERELPVVVPTIPGASVWLSHTMREGDRYVLNPR